MNKMRHVALKAAIVAAGITAMVGAGAGVASAQDPWEEPARINPVWPNLAGPNLCGPNTAYPDCEDFWTWHDHYTGKPIGVEEYAQTYPM